MIIYNLGQKVCLHVHQVYPYLTLCLDHVFEEDINEANILSMLHKLAGQIEIKLDSQNKYANNNPNAYFQYIHNIELFKAKYDCFFIYFK